MKYVVFTMIFAFTLFFPEIMRLIKRLILKDINTESENNNE